jgi:hypothetical protein
MNVPFLLSSNEFSDNKAEKNNLNNPDKKLLKGKYFSSENIFNIRCSFFSSNIPVT